MSEGREGVTHDAAAPRKPGQRRRFGPQQKYPSRAAPVGQLNEDPFAPRFLAKPGPVNDDPLADKCFFPRVEEALAPTAGESYVYPGSEGLVQLATEEYATLAAHSYSMKRSISVSGYCYYAACLAWARLLEIDAANGGRQTNDERSFVEGMRKYRPPKLLGLYLAGFGNTDFPGGFHQLVCRIRKPPSVVSAVAPNLPGFFGPMQDNARYYASYPCISVFATRVMQDLSVSAGEADVIWDLPTDLSYAGHPLTTMCIGYQPAQPLNQATVSTYAACGVTRQRFDFDNDTIAVNWSFLNQIQLWTAEVQDVVSAPVVTGTTGSRGQLLTERLVSTRSSFQHLTWRATCAFKLPVSVESAGSTFLYRIQKRYEGTGSQALNARFCPFNVTNYSQVPNDLNFLRDHERDPLLKATGGISPEYTLATRLRIYSASDIKVG